MGQLNLFGMGGVATADAELRFVGNNGTALATVNLAFNRSFRKNDKWEQETSFIRATVWGNKAEKFAELVKKGSVVSVSGYMRQNTWTDDDDNKRSMLIFNVLEWSLVDKNTNGDESSNRNKKQNKTKKSAKSKNKEQAVAVADSDDDDDVDDNVPF